MNPSTGHRIRVKAAVQSRRLLADQDPEEEVIVDRWTDRLCLIDASRPIFKFRLLDGRVFNFVTSQHHAFRTARALRFNAIPDPSLPTMAERFRSLVTELTTEFSAKKLILEEQEKRLTEERERLTKEKAVMTKIQCSDDDIVHLNVGGTIFATKRGSLRLVSITSLTKGGMKSMMTARLQAVCWSSCSVAAGKIVSTVIKMDMCS